VLFPNLQAGEYFLFAGLRKSGTSKLLAKIKGPRRIGSVESDYVFVEENFVTEELKAAYETLL
jgi:hypothetical protein